MFLQDQLEKRSALFGDQIGNLNSQLFFVSERS
jgi:hypothetical protein